MTRTARVLWIFVVLSLVAGGVAVGLLVRARSAAAEDLRHADNRWKDVHQESQEQPVRIAELKEDRKDRLRLQRECFIVILAQIKALNELIRETRTVPSVPALESHANRARVMLLDFRQLLSFCEAG